MCTLVLSLEAENGSLRVAANRDEAYARPSEPPRTLDEGARLFGGRDAVAGGTWLALRLTPPRRLVAILNRREHAPPLPGDTKHLSRGLLCLEAGRISELAALPSLLRDRVATFPVAPFTLLAAEPGVVLTYAFEGDDVRETVVGPGLHAWTHGEADDPGDPRVRQVLAAARDAATPRTLASFADAVLPALSSHDGERPVCLHGERYGTVSAAFVALSADGVPEFRFAPGPPCTTPAAALALPG